MLFAVSFFTRHALTMLFAVSFFTRHALTMLPAPLPMRLKQKDTAFTCSAPF
jgi:hypothetical protein